MGFRALQSAWDRPGLSERLSPTVSYGALMKILQGNIKEVHSGRGCYIMRMATEWGGGFVLWPLMGCSLSTSESLAICIIHMTLFCFKQHSPVLLLKPIIRPVVSA